MEYNGDLYYRIHQINEIDEIVYLINNKLQSNKKGKSLLKIFAPYGLIVVINPKKVVDELI